MRKATARRWLLPTLVYAALTSAVVSSLGMLLVPTVADALAISVSSAQWMLTVNLLVGAIATPIMGRLSDGPHTKRILLISLIVIAIGSIIAATATDFAIFLVGRGLQGLSYGVVPMTIALARRYLPPAATTPAISTLSVTVATGLGVGYPLTGILASLLGFRAAFGFAAVFVLSAAAVLWVAVPNGSDARIPRPAFDLPGAIGLGLGLSALLLTASEGSNWGWLSAPTLGVGAAALTLLGTWVWVELRASNPLINLRVIRNRDVLLANGTAIGLGTALYMSLSISSLIAQAPHSTGYGIELPLFWAGFVMLPLSVGSLSANRIVRVVSRRVAMTSFLPVGACVMAASALLLRFAHDQLWEILVGMLLFGLGMGTTYAAMPALIARNVAMEELGSAVSFNQVLRTVGGAFGSAISGAVLAAHLAADMPPTNQGIGIALTIAVLVSGAVCAVLVGNYLYRSSRRRTPGPQSSATDHGALRDRSAPWKGRDR
ncbi:MFS transporter [Nocardia sp. NPDC058518]|uniref:MFS transporter n=1 Tax=Nocardia sp. NPDC058518 TaxID=3346534 RepID=UPI003667879F